MLEVDCEESWAPKNWCFWTVVLEETLESPLDCNEIHLVHFNGDQSCVFIGRTDAKAETPILWPPQLIKIKSWLTGKDSDAGRDSGQEEKGTTEDEMVGWHHRLYWHESEWTPGVGDGQGGLVCCDSWGRRVGHDWATDLNSPDLIWISSDWLNTQKVVYSTNAIYFEDTYGSSKVLERNTEVWFKIMSQFSSTKSLIWV